MTATLLILSILSTLLLLDLWLDRNDGIFSADDKEESK